MLAILVIVRARPPDDLVPLADLGRAPRRAGVRSVGAAAVPDRRRAGRRAVPRRLRLLPRADDGEVAEREAAERGARVAGGGVEERSRRGAASGAEEATALRGRPELPAGLPRGERERDLVPRRSVRPADRDRCGRALRHPPQHAGRHRRRARRTRHERRAEHRRRDAAHRRRQRRRREGPHHRRRGTDPARPGPVVDPRPRSEGSGRAEGRPDRDAGDARPAVPGPLSVRDPDRPRALRRHSDNAIFLQVQVAPWAQFGSFTSVAALVSAKPAPKLP